MRLLLAGLALAALVLIFAGSSLFAPRLDSSAGEGAERVAGADAEAPDRGAVLQGRAVGSGAGRDGGAGLAGVVLRGGHGEAARVTVRAVRGRDPKAPLFAVRACWIYEDLVGVGSVVAETRSREDGRFVVEGIVPGRYEVRASGHDGALASVAVDLPAAGVQERVVLRLPSGEPLLAGVARYVDGRPFRGYVRVHHHDVMDRCFGPFGARVDWGVGLFPTDADGRFAIRSVAPGTLRLAAFVPGRCRAVSPVLTLPHEGLYEWIVDDGCVEVTGEVVAGPQQKPVANARVEATGARARAEVVRVVTATDAAGRFHLRIPPRDVVLRVFALGHVPTVLGQSPSEVANVTWNDVSSSGQRYGGQERFELPADRHVVLALRRTGRIEGRVFDADETHPVAHLPVHAFFTHPAMGSTARSAVSDGEGRYVLSGLPPGDVIVFAVGGGRMSEDLALAGEWGHGAQGRVVVPEGGVATLDLGTIPTGGIRGRILGPDGDPVAGALVRCLPSQEDPAAEGFPLERRASPAWLGLATTGADGRFAFDTLVPGFPYRIHVLAAGYARAVSAAVVGPEQRWRDLDVHLAAGRTVHVRVLDVATGEGIPDARVGLGYASVRTWTTDQEGRVAIAEIGEGKSFVWVRASGYPGLARAPAVPPADASSANEEIVIRMERGAWISGRVVTPEGIPPNCVSVSPTLGGTWGPATTEDGRFRIGPVPPGPIELRAWLRCGVASIRESVKVVAPATDTVVDLRDACARAAQEGRVGTAWRLLVVDREGRPVDRAHARLWWYLPRGYIHHAGTFAVRRGKATHWIRADAPAGEARLAVWGAKGLGAVLGQRVDPRRGEVRVVLPDALTVAGRVVWEDGRPASGLLVRCGPSGSPWAVPDADKQFGRGRGWSSQPSARCDAQGRFRLEGLGEGPYAVWPMLPQGAQPFRPVPRASAGAENLRIVLRRGVSPVIRVVDQDGRPVAGCDIEVDDGSERWDARAAETDGAGRARVSGLDPEGHYELRIEPPYGEPPYGRGDLLAECLPAWDPVDTTITLPRAYATSGIVEARVDAGRLVVRWCAADASDEDWRIVMTRGTPPAFEIPRLRKGQQIRLVAARMGESVEGRSEVLATAGQTGVVLTLP